MAIPKINVGDVVTAFDQDYVVVRVHDGVLSYDLWTDRGWLHSRCVERLVRRTVIGWRHYRSVPAMGDKCMLPMKAAFSWKHSVGGRVVRVIRKRTWRKEGTK